MLSSKAFRTAGLVALCLLVGGVLFGALGGAQQQPPLPQLQVIVKGDPTFEGIRNGIPSLSMIKIHDDYFLIAVNECGTTIAQIISFGVANHRKNDGGELMAIGGIRARETLTLGGKGAFPKGDYFLFLGHAEVFKLQLPPGIEMAWFMAMTDPKGEIMAIIWPWPWPPPGPPDVMDGDMMLRALETIISSKLECCDLTVRHLSLSARRISPPNPHQPYTQWDIMALATIANIGQKDVKEPFTVRVLLNGRFIHEEEIAELAAGAQQMILASAMVDRPGLYIVTVMVDPADKIKERDETNNIAERSIYIQ